jgi:hypothetical protein
VPKAEDDPTAAAREASGRACGRSTPRGEEELVISLLKNEIRSHTFPEGPYSLQVQ